MLSRGRRTLPARETFMGARRIQASGRWRSHDVKAGARRGREGRGTATTKGYGAQQ